MQQDNVTLFPQATRFLNRLLAMDEACQHSFRRIYALAPRHSLSSEEMAHQKSLKMHPLQLSIAVGRHVRVAMVESLSHPAIAEWVRMNLALRIGLKLAESTHQKKRAGRLEAVLEAFHVASDAFIYSISLEKAQALRLAKSTFAKTKHVPESIALWKDGELLDLRLAEEIKAIAEFKKNVIPGFAHAIRRQS